MKQLLSFLVIISAFFTTCTAKITGNKPANQLSDEWKNTVTKNYNEFIAEVDGDENKIPIIVTTDQHGAITMDSQVYDFFNKLVDWSKVSKILNLGDTVRNEYNFKELFAYQAATRNLPSEKRIEVCGNHDRAGLKTSDGMKVSRIFFHTDGAVYSADKRVFVVTDKQFGIRYLAVDPKVSPWSYGSGFLTKDMADFIIKEFAKTNEPDIVLISHPYLFKDAVIDRNGQTFTGSEWFIGDAENYTQSRDSFIEMLEARKNGTSGVLVDSVGVSHPYDFSKADSEFLMALHGHHHTEGYETKNGITEFLFQSMTYDNAKNTEPLCTYFAYIDKQTNTLKVWKNLEGYSAWEITFA
ncbi:MAG: hypothetical protein MJ177_01930 [Clostridia bacterium]|nr:hypothetical protein [Clostridia bacterium]